MRKRTVRRVLLLLTCGCLLLGIAIPSLASGDRTAAIGDKQARPGSQGRQPGNRGRHCRATKGKRRSACQRHPKATPAGPSDPSEGPAGDAQDSDGDEGVPSFEDVPPFGGEEDQYRDEDLDPTGEQAEETPADEGGYTYKKPVREKEEPPPPPPPPTSPSTSLRWPPPPLVNPTTISLGTQYTLTRLDPTKDYIVNLPSSKKIGGTVLVGGHNIVIVGGAISVPPGTRSDTERRGIYVKEATGTVHIEGVEIDGSAGGYFDGIDIAAPQATVQLQNIRILGVKGGYNGFHGDVVQPWGGVKTLRIDHLTATSNYQGLMLQPELGPIGSAEISNVDITTTDSSEPPNLAGGHMIWLTKGSNSCISFSAKLSNVFVKPRPGRSLGTSVWPPTNTTLPCKAKFETMATWPNLAVTGGVSEGPAPTSFVAAGAAGLTY
jgi:hypothetical protein